MSEPKPCILVADDDRSALDLIMATLSGEMTVRVARDGAMALKLLKKSRPDLLLLDVMMPGLDGFAICRLMKEDPDLRDIPVIFLTARTDAGDETRGLQLGAVDYILKPFNQAILRARVDNHLELKRYRDQLNALVEQRTREQGVVLDNISEMVWVKDTAGRFLAVNRAFAAACGQAAPPALVGKRDVDVWPEAVARRFAREDAKVIKTRTRRESVEQVLGGDGVTRWWETVRTPICDGRGVLQGTVGIARDSTDRKEREEEIQRANALLRSLTGRLADAEERQLKIISRELHDQIGQNVSAIALNLTLIRTLLDLNEGKARIGASLEDSLALLQETTVRIRQLLADMRSPVLDDHGLLAALRLLSRQCGRRGNLKITVRGRDPHPRPAAVVENALFRIAQEGLNNVLKHAQAARVSLVLSTSPDRLRLSLQDDGMGYNAEALDMSSARHGWGLITMKERAMAVGGRLAVSSSPGKGTKLTVEVTL